MFTSSIAILITIIASSVTCIPTEPQAAVAEATTLKLNTTQLQGKTHFSAIARANFEGCSGIQYFGASADYPAASLLVWPNGNEIFDGIWGMRSCWYALDHGDVCSTHKFNNDQAMIKVCFNNLLSDVKPQVATIEAAKCFVGRATGFSLMISSLELFSGWVDKPRSTLRSITVSFTRSNAASVKPTKPILGLSCTSAVHPSIGYLIDDFHNTSFISSMAFTAILMKSKRWTIPRSPQAAALSTALYSTPLIPISVHPQRLNSLPQQPHPWYPSKASSTPEQHSENLHDIQTFQHTQHDTQQHQDRPSSSQFPSFVTMPTKTL
ncbi:hypothetical protein HDU97_005795 [Phlyctochytrium planicorne]|nr:hypothetical protein HDU97_005795 [Phlyctochytrium planicorne]